MPKFTKAGIIKKAEKEKVKDADLLKFPTDIKTVDPAEEKSIGDMHGNALKLIHFLISEGVLKTNEADYLQLVQIYERLYNDDYKSNLAQTRKDIEAFNKILGRAEIASSTPLIRLIGD